MKAKIELEPSHDRGSATKEEKEKKMLLFFFFTKTRIKLDKLK